MFELLHQHPDITFGAIIYLVIALIFFLGIWVNRDDTWSLANIIEDDKLYDAAIDRQLLITLRMSILWPIGFLLGVAEFIDCFDN